MINILSHKIACQVKILSGISKNIRCGFADDKSHVSKERGDDYTKNMNEKKQVKIDQKYRVKSAALYDKYVQSREKPMLSLDQYQINYCWILQRIPIFFPYQKHYFQYYKNRYQMAKKTGYIIPLPKDLTIQQGDYLFAEYQKANPQNIPSHETMINNQTTFYRQNARYWRYADPNITDQKSVQTYSSDNVFFIVQNNAGEWIFPQRPISQKQSHDDFFKSFSGQLFGGQAYPNLYFEDKKPNFVAKEQKQNMQKGKGIKTFYFQGYSLSGIPKYPAGSFTDYKWVPKPHLHKYFTPQYTKKVIKLATFCF